ncbi:sodium:proton antiporter [Eubacterium oxidoreducens]|uniref:Multicomponent Na+:H+ antiporter subunit C n=1 Tax=Eubacterium oxidoreducens TaxID=1732 RepID=A0A1G6BSE7_EUBOX|nr:sodium:proton antiporter [Eubacterium oxidoreducens]SDB23535.1 multicomponent Na+:H+ antiporter subunit C [Eubacterium oxidoreducens]
MMIDMFQSLLASRGIYCLIFVMFFIAIFGMITCKNYMKKMMCMNIMQVAVILFFLCFAQKTGTTIPILEEGNHDADQYMNPIPHALMLTAIVVSLGTTGVALSLLMRLKEHYGSVEEDKILNIKQDEAEENK